MTTVPRLRELIEQISRHASVRGDGLAIADESRRVTYAQLVAEVEDRAHRLCAAGIIGGDRIAVVAENSADYLATVLAIWTASAVPVTIYPSTSVADLGSTLVDADPVLVLADASTFDLVSAAAGGHLRVARLDEADAVIDRFADASPTPEAIRSELALVCYSSGTTARPKAIMIGAAAILNSARTFAEMWRLDESDVTLVCLPMAWLFGLTTSSITTLAAGGAVVSLRRAKPHLIASSIDEHRVTFLPAVTTVLAKLANHLDDVRKGSAGHSSLRLIVSGGEPRNEASFARLRAHWGIPVHDNYCASEMQPLVTYDPTADPEPRPGSAGRLVPRSELRILDLEGEPVGPGETGEAFSRGPGLMLGYWNDPEGSRAALTEDGWYRTKDLLRVDDEGYVYVVGRTSDTIIRGGSNVSPSEVEHHLRSHPDVTDIAVVGVPDALYGEEVVAVLTLREGTHLDAEGLTAFTKTKLSGFKVPTRYVHVPSLPLNATGKVDRRAVRQQLAEGD